MSHEQALQVLVAGSGTHFDPAVVDAFLTAAPLLQHVAREERVTTDHREVALS
jgi:response regulator RpfG family c-di-GMP phosphodiesterase